MLDLPVTIAAEEEGGSFLVSPNVGLMIWTLLVFGISLWVLGKYAFPRIAEALDRRQKAIEDSIDAAEKTRKEAEEILAEYRERLAEARGQADDIVSRARKTGEAAETEIVADARAKREEMMEQTRRDIEAETRRAIQAIRSGGGRPHRARHGEGRPQVAHRRGPEAARRRGPVRARLRVAGRRGARPLMEEIATVYARALFDVAQEQDKLDDVRDQLGAFADALSENRELQVFFFSPYFSTAEKEDGLERVVTGAEPAIVNFLKLLIEKHRMPVLFRIRATYDAMWEEENKLLPVSITSAVELDEGTVKELGDRIQEQTGRKVELSSQVEPDILGGIVVQVGNSVLDASVRNRLEQLRKQVVKA